LAGQTAGRNRVVLDLLFLLYQDKRKSKKKKKGITIEKSYKCFIVSRQKKRQKKAS
jgi:hypothetical protein